jgi:ribosome-associated protein
MLLINSRISIPEGELHEEFLRSPGPGGQHVNKSETAVRLSFDAAASPSIPPDVRQRLLRLAGTRATEAGVIAIEAHNHRSQKQNREEARTRLTELIRAAARPPKKRTKTKPTKGAKERRLAGKKSRSEVKRTRGRVNRED